MNLASESAALLTGGLVLVMGLLVDRVLPQRELARVRWLRRVAFLGLGALAALVSRLATGFS